MAVVAKVAMTTVTADMTTVTAAATTVTADMTTGGSLPGSDRGPTTSPPA